MGIRQQDHFPYALLACNAIHFWQNDPPYFEQKIVYCNELKMKVDKTIVVEEYH